MCTFKVVAVAIVECLIDKPVRKGAERVQNPEKTIALRTKKKLAIFIKDQNKYEMFTESAPRLIQYSSHNFCLCVNVLVWLSHLIYCQIQSNWLEV